MKKQAVNKKQIDDTLLKATFTSAAYGGPTSLTDENTFSPESINGFQFTDREMATLRELLSKGFLFGGDKNNWEKAEILCEEYSSAIADGVGRKVKRVSTKFFCERKWGDNMNNRNNRNNDCMLYKLHDKLVFTKNVRNDIFSPIGNEGLVFTRQEKTELFGSKAPGYLAIVLHGLPMLVNDLLLGTRNKAKRLADIEAKVIQEGGLILGVSQEIFYVYFPFKSDQVVDKLLGYNYEFHIPSLEAIRRFIVENTCQKTVVSPYDETFEKIEKPWLISGENNWTTYNPSSTTYSPLTPSTTTSNGSALTEDNLNAAVDHLENEY